MALSQDGRDAIRFFNRFAAIAFAVGFTVHVTQLFYGPHSSLLLFVCNLVTLLGLAYVGTQAHLRSDGEFDSAVAAETVVAFGVLALILGLATAIIPLLSLDPAKLRFDPATLRSMGEPFVQGLAAAGVAPVVAVLLRNFSAQHDGADSSADEFRQLALAAARLTGELGRAKAAAAELSRALAAGAQVTANLGPDLQAHLDGVAAATGQIAPKLTASVAALTQSLDGGGRDFADQMDQAGKRFVTGLDDARTGIGAIAAAAKAGTADVTGLNAEFSRLRSNAAESAELLSALGELAASVERFVSARNAA